MSTPLRVCHHPFSPDVRYCYWISHSDRFQFKFGRIFMAEEARMVLWRTFHRCCCKHILWRYTQFSGRIQAIHASKFSLCPFQHFDSKEVDCLPVWEWWDVPCQDFWHEISMILGRCSNKASLKPAQRLRWYFFRVPVVQALTRLSFPAGLFLSWGVWMSPWITSQRTNLLEIPRGIHYNSSSWLGWECKKVY